MIEPLAKQQDVFGELIQTVKTLNCPWEEFELGGTRILINVFDLEQEVKPIVLYIVNNSSKLRNVP